ncbi:sigma-w pathway protein ysdB [Halalkalibacter oceani]|uniref:Sigma-w pathway protein ysdB n=1 Tax=Halalkalibacter oceani TaxID=1653776 RepID=A0A9X2DRW9_9BACI|nr:sigma-w pathway protein ysdB [Halalkalibacter oceani]MCM3716006.1 sigma-w pathway protein ysdB [Halalkalibacter oceani]MCM3759696.1 sigma-w pathway protein ysdB [Halalkalibacter oceani]
MVILFRFLILLALIILAYSALKYLFHPRRKLEQAHERQQFFFYDDEKDVRKNFLLTYKGVMFEGEKYLGTTEDSFEIVSVYIWARQTDRLNGFSKEDFQFIADDVHLRYPNAKIEWKSPIKELLRKE